MAHWGLHHWTSSTCKGHGTQAWDWFCILGVRRSCFTRSTVQCLTLDDCDFDGQVDCTCAVKYALIAKYMATNSESTAL